MSYRNQYSGSPWQKGGPPFNFDSYNQNYSRYNDQYGVSIMNTGYNRNQDGFGSRYSDGMYSGSSMGQMRSMSYSGPSQSRHYMSGRSPRGQLQRKRLPQRSPAGAPRSKRPNLGNDKRSTKTRHRDSYGGSKSRHDRSNESNAYNPEKPTDEISDSDYESFEIWNCSDDDSKAEETENKENGDQEANVSTEGTEMETKSADDAKTKKLHLCYVCKVKCPTKEVLTKHYSCKSHTEKIEELLAIQKEEKKDVAGGDKKSVDQDRKKSTRKPGNWCTVCECAFSGNFHAHRRTEEHRKKRDKKYPTCRPCRIEFKSSDEYRDHYKSEVHKQRSAEFHYLKNLLSGSDEDEAAIEPVKIKEEPEEEILEVEEKTDIQDSAATEAEDTSEEPSEDKDEEENNLNEKETSEDKDKEENNLTEKKTSEDKDKEEKKEIKKSKIKEPKSVGQSFVVSVQGYYCKLCRKFFKDGSVAKSKHCRSIMHTDAFKTAMEEALKQEEERQKLAEEQDKRDRESIEAAERVAAIQAIELAAKEAIKKEAAAKKAGLKKQQVIKKKDDVEDNSKSGKDEEMDASEGASAENGIKDDEEKEELEEIDDEKEESPDDKMKENESVKDDQLEEEQEETKEEVTSSPATRRGRGRGRKRR